VEADVYVWRYALLVVHARKEEEELASVVPGTCKSKAKTLCGAEAKESGLLATGV